MRNNKGSIIFMVLWIAALTLFAALALSQMILQDMHLVQHLKDSIQAQFSAEAGVSSAVAVLFNQGFAAKDNPANFPSTSFADGTYDVTVVQSGGRVLLSSVGVHDGVSRTAAMEVKNLYPEVMNYSLATGGDITIKSVQGDITIKGDMHANGDLDISEQGSPTTVSVQAEAPATGKVTSTGSYGISGAVTIADGGNSGGGKPMLSMLSINFGDLKAIAQADGTYYGSSQNFNNAALTGGTAGLIYVDGDVTFTGTSTITGGFVAAGRIDENNGNTITQSHDAGNRFPIFIASGECKLYGIFNTVDGNLVFSSTSIKIRTPGGISTVLGTVVSGGWYDIVANGDLTLTYYAVEANEVIPGGIQILSWNY